MRVPLLLGLACLFRCNPALISQGQIEHYMREGFVVVPDVLTHDEVQAARNGMHDELRQAGVDPHDLNSTANNLRYISGGVAGIVDRFYSRWKFAVLSKSRVIQTFTELLAATWAKQPPPPGFEHPFGRFDTSKALWYIDRFAFRLPDSVVEVATEQGGFAQALQFQLGPHVDCNPYAPHDTLRAASDDKDGTFRWRPIQAIVALTDCADGDTNGGLRVAAGLHRDLESYVVQTRSADTRFEHEVKDYIGNFYGLNEELDGGTVLPKARSVAHSAGSMVLWDLRLPHYTAPHSDAGDTPREVIYAGFLPFTRENQVYAQSQLEHMQQGLAPPDFGGKAVAERVDETLATVTAVGRSLLGLEAWPPDATRHWMDVQHGGPHDGPMFEVYSNG